MANKLTQNRWANLTDVWEEFLRSGVDSPPPDTTTKDTQDKISSLLGINLRCSSPHYQDINEVYNVNLYCL
jgi:hypothetical protein